MGLDLSVHGDEFNRFYTKWECLWDDFTDLDMFKKTMNELVKIEAKYFTDDMYNIYHGKIIKILDRYRDLPRLRRWFTMQC